MALTSENLDILFKPLFREDDFESLQKNRPYLSHYTTIEVLEKILKDQEIWFSNPLFMNDFHEMSLGINDGVNLFLQSPEIDAIAKGTERAKILRDLLSALSRNFAVNHAVDTLILCLSEHNITQTDGKLSMWRAYGGQGKGAALVFNSGFVTQGNSPLIIAQVQYKTNDERIALLKNNFAKWCLIMTENNFPNDSLAAAAHFYFQAIKMFALTVKHKGFEEENEWRIIYFPDLDSKEVLKKKLGYSIGKLGVEPKLKFKIEPIQGTENQNWNFQSILEQIILGPSISELITRTSVYRMVEQLRGKEFANKIRVSTIPFRSL